MMVRELKLTYGASVFAPLADIPITEPSASVALVHPLLHDQTSERFVVVPLSHRYLPVGYRAFDGTLTYVAVEPADIFRTVLLANASCFLVAHNHPSGDVTPSPDDIGLTERLKAGATLLGVELVDHLILGHHNRYYSFREMGRL